MANCKNLIIKSGLQLLPECNGVDDTPGIHGVTAMVASFTSCLVKLIIGDWGVSAFGFNELTLGGIGGGALLRSELVGPFIGGGKNSFSGMVPFILLFAT